MADSFLTIKQRNSILNEWLSTIPQRFSTWFDQLPKDLQKQLDYSPNSLIPLEKQYLRKSLRNKYGSTSNFSPEEFKFELDCIGYYVGQVFIKNLPISLVWYIGEYTDKKERFPVILKSPDYNNINVIFFNRIRLITIASEDEYDDSANYLLNFYEKVKKICKQKIDENDLKENYALAIRLDDNYQYFLLHKTDTNPLSQIKALLEEYFKTRDNPPKLSYYRDKEDYLIIEMADDYCFHLKFKQGDRVKQLIQEMAENKYSGKLDKKDIAQCQSITEFWGDQDNNMDYINEALWLLEYIAPRLPDLVTIYDLKNGTEIYP